MVVAVAAVSLYRFRGDTETSALVNAVMALVGVNGVILGLAYLTLGKVRRRLSKSGIEAEAFANGALWSIIFAWLGVVFGAWFLAWEPDHESLAVVLALCVCLLPAPLLLVTAAIQEQVAIHQASEEGHSVPEASETTGDDTLMEP